MTNVQTKPIESMKLNFKFDNEYQEFMEYILNPPPASEFVNDLIKNY